MATKIVMFTKNNCPNCMRAKMLLDSCPVEVEIIEKNIEESIEAYDECVNKYESNTAPTFRINGRTIMGFNEGEIMDELGL